MAGGVNWSRWIRYWMLLVAFFRVSAVYFGYMDIHKLKIAVFTDAPGEATALAGRCFACWTSITCLLCIAFARNPFDAAVFGGNLASFLIASAFFLLELFRFHTVGKRGISPIVVAGLSITFLLLWRRRLHAAGVRRAAPLPRVLLTLAGAADLLLAATSYLAAWELDEHVFTRQPTAGAALQARTFGVWRAACGVLSLLAAGQSHSRELRGVSLAAAVVTCVFTMLETTVYGTMDVEGAAPLLTVAGVSALVLLATIPPAGVSGIKGAKAL